jgi:phosphoribosylformylglycinamidine synthase II
LAVDPRVLAEIALSPEEYELIVDRLDREPNDVELGMFGALWSEHCGYKNSKPLLRELPDKRSWPDADKYSGRPYWRVLTQMGGENAGAVDIGDGLCVVMKIESHNHPSAIEPYEGAATGVGGIVRDIFAMGARPIAILDSLRFGPLTDPHNRYLFAGVVGGIGGYGNCLGIPTIAGEVGFAPAYSANPLVNAMCVGIGRTDHLVRGIAGGPGNPIFLVGADTGRDGIGGANVLASRVFDEASSELRPTVQVGNPFMEKLLMEACLELAEKHPDWFVGIQDLGAAGLTSASVESAGRGGAGIELDISRVPRREQGMVPYEVMLSESQERMLVIARKEHAAKVRAHFEHWELHVVEIGTVTDDGYARVREDERPVASLPVAVLTDPPEYRREGRMPAGLDELQRFDLSSLPDIDPSTASDVLLRLLSTPEISSKRWVWRQYDHQVLTNTVVGPGADAAIMRIKGSRKAIALTTDGSGHYCYLDPHAGGAIAVAEAARNVVCVGAEPIAVTDCLNFGNPENPEVYYQMGGVVAGMAEACRTLNTPVISGNVSLYNETNGEAVYPTPVVGMLGLLEDVDRRCGMGFLDEGDTVVLLGIVDTPVESLAGSDYVREVHGRLVGQPQIELPWEVRVQRTCLDAIHQGILHSAHDCSHGGLAVALAESCVAGGIGFELREGRHIDRLDAWLFGEGQSRIIVSVRPGDEGRLLGLTHTHHIPFTILGTVGGSRLVMRPYIDVSVTDLTRAYEEGLPRALEG